MRDTWKGELKEAGGPWFPGGFLARRRRNVHCARPHQCNDPAIQGPAQEKVQQKNGKRVPLVPRQSHNRGGKVNQEAEAKKRPEQEGEEDESEKVHAAAPPLRASLPPHTQSGWLRFPGVRHALQGTKFVARSGRF